MRFWVNNVRTRSVDGKTPRVHVCEMQEEAQQMGLLDDASQAFPQPGGPSDSSGQCHVGEVRFTFPGPDPFRRLPGTFPTAARMQTTPWRCSAPGDGGAGSLAGNTGCAMTWPRGTASLCQDTDICDCGFSWHARVSRSLCDAGRQWVVCRARAGTAADGPAPRLLHVAQLCSHHPSAVATTEVGAWLPGPPPQHPWPCCWWEVRAEFHVITGFLVQSHPLSGEHFSKKRRRYPVYLPSSLC